MSGNRETSAARAARIAAEPDPEDETGHRKSLSALMSKRRLTGLAVQIALVRQGHPDMITASCLQGIISVLAQDDSTVN